ncbi:hypothetical protein jhhlp_002819, partial [Lomentospora prolificans]
SFKMLWSLGLLATFASSALAGVVTKTWDIGWVNASPDGVARPVIGINGEWPCPPLHVDIGDKVVIHVTNSLGNQSTSLHWHGMYQEGTTHMDGASQVSQCPIPPGRSFTYEFYVKQPGTYWYHAHIGAQYSDGLRAPLIVHDRGDPFNRDFDEEYTLTLSDWYHDQTPVLLEQLFEISNVQARPPLPKSGLINDGQGSTYKFAPGKKYKFRIINVSALAGVIFSIDDHVLTIVEVDGIYTQPADAEQIYLTAGQRYSVIVEARDCAESNYAINAVFDLNPDYHTPSPQIGFNINATGCIEYDSSFEVPGQTIVNQFNIFDDMWLEPYDEEPLLGEPDQQITMDFRLGLDDQGIPRAFLNNVSYVSQKTPTLYTALSVGEDASSPEVYGQVNPHVIERGQVIEIILNNLTPGHHPFHLHGHHFQVINRLAANAGSFNAWDEELASSPLRRDTIDVNSVSSARIRFRADNPGVWLFHCHLEWHVPMGLVATFIESPFEVQKMIRNIPKSHFEICQEQCYPTKGNAAGNTADHFDLAGATDPHQVPTRGAQWNNGLCGVDNDANVNNGEEDSDGTHGEDSADGDDGADGADGSDSVDGADDADGADGPDGDEGSISGSGCDVKV